MPMAERIYTASEIARGALLSEKRVKQLFAVAGVPFELRRAESGQKVQHWPLAVIRKVPRLLESLNVILQTGAHRDLAHVLEDASARWQPTLPLSEIDAEQARAAKARCALIGPAMPCGGPILNFRPIVEAVLEGVKASPDLKASSPSAVRGWITRANDRDRGFQEWLRWEIWLDEAIKRRTAAPAALVSEGRAAGEMNDAFWTECCHLVRKRVEASSTCFEDARKAVLREMVAPICASVKERNAAQTQFGRKWKEFEKHGKIKSRVAENSGRRSISELLPDDDAAELRLKIAAGTSAIYALERYAKTERCPPALAAYILKPRQSPDSFSKVLRARIKPTAEQVAFAQSGQNYRAQTYTPRDNTLVEGGVRRVWDPGDVWEFDDMDLNYPFHYENPEGTNALATRHGVGIGRQGLYCVDAASGRFLGVELIARDGGAYRAEDILRFFRKLFSIYGLPRVGLRLEKGVWKSKGINGVSIAIIDGETQERLKISFAAEFGITIEFAEGPQGKGLIESWFRHFQKAMDYELSGKVPSYGKWRGERPDDSKRIQRVMAGVVHPTAEGIPSISTMRDIVLRIGCDLNERRKRGRIQKGVPQDLWEAALEVKPLHEMAAEGVHLLCPEKRPLSLRDGMVKTTVDGVVYFFNAEEAFIDLGTGYSVILCFDPSEPSLGAAVLNAEEGSQNHRRYRPGQFICLARLHEYAPNYVAGGGYRDENIEGRKRRNRAFRSALGIPKGRAAKDAMCADELRDGKGMVHRLERNGQGVPLLASPEADRAESYGRDLQNAAREMQARRYGEVQRKTRLLTSEQECAREQENTQRCLASEWIDMTRGMGTEKGQREVWRDVMTALDAAEPWAVRLVEAHPWSPSFV